MMTRHPFETQRRELFALLTILVLLAVALLQGCANMQKPVTGQDYLQETKAQIAGVYNSIADLTNSGQISKAEGRKAFEKVVTLEKNVRNVELAMLTSSDNAPTAAQYTQWISTLAAISAELKAAQAAKGK